MSSAYIFMPNRMSLFTRKLFLIFFIFYDAFVFCSDEVFADKVPKCLDCEGVVKPG